MPEPLSVLSLVISLVALWQASRAFRAQQVASTLLTHLSAIVQVESRLGELPEALRFHCVAKEELDEAGVTPPELAYLLNSFTLGSVRQDILAPTVRDAFSAGNYRYCMCQSKATRNAWPLVKRLMNPSPFIERIDRTIENIERDGANTASCITV